MPLNTNKKLPLSQIKKLSAALALALAIPLGAHAASLGKLTVLSSLGQPLRAEIEVTSVGADEVGKLSAKLASADAFSRANVDYNPVLSSLSFAVEQRQGRYFIRISSSQPVSDPFVDLLLELSAGNAKLVREYTFLLDPADSKTPRNAQVAPLTPSAPAAKSEPAPSAASEAPSPALQQVAPAAAPASAPAPAPAPAPISSPAPAPAVTPAPAASAPIPVSGEEPATTIVQRAAPSALAEELIRRQQASPDATPASASPEAAPVTTGQSASGEVVRPAAAAPAAGKAADYRVKQGDTLAGIALRNKQANVSLDQMLIALYRANPDAFMGNNINRLRAGRVLAIPDQPTASAVDQNEAHGMVVAQAQDFNAYRNKLASQVANAPAGKPRADRQSGGGKITTRVEERSGASSAKDRLELSRANGRKGNTGNAGLAEEKAAADRALSDANDRVKELEKNVGDLQKLLEMKNKTIADLGEQQKPGDAAKATPAPEAAKPEEKPAATPAPAAPAAPVAPAPAKPASKSGFIDSVLENPYILAGVGGAAALLVAALGVVGVRRRKKKAEEPAAEESAEPEPAPAPIPAPASESAAAAVAEAAVEQEPPAAVAEEPAAAAEEESPVDPIAEADMYIAYGRDEQAEDILKLALQTQPERQALHSKLLEIYAKRQDVGNFNKVALDLHQLSGGLNEAWVKAASLGIVLDPTNPLYGGTPEEPAAPEPEEQGMEFDLSDFKGAEIQPSAAMPAVDLGKGIDFDLDLENGAKPDDNEPILPASASASSLLDSGDAKPAMSLADLDLDLPAESPVAPSASANLLEEDEESAFEAEMTTKLDLAAAYQEIGDKEGARELLEEVTRGGNDAQVARAKDMLSKLA
ncbi:FimV/HubP family polar landmark protein [Herbaspirillum chlorophenolicum]|uniref:FimV/HubP family polar landmark protein n=1 Tax=Herbaspirillum chlorophenolicum TaxID=211589 RepID=UPI00067C8D26|nr:FimV/HubP family polar landmark protein [Herbaspirillum chlorophenolicum]